MVIGINQVFNENIRIFYTLGNPGEEALLSASIAMLAKSVEDDC